MSTPNLGLASGCADVYLVLSVPRLHGESWIRDGKSSPSLSSEGESFQSVDFCAAEGMRGETMMSLLELAKKVFLFLPGG